MTPKRQNKDKVFEEKDIFRIKINNCVQRRLKSGVKKTGETTVGNSGAN